MFIIRQNKVSLADVQKLFFPLLCTKHLFYVNKKRIFRVKVKVHPECIFILVRIKRNRKNAIVNIFGLNLMHFKWKFL